MNDDKEEKQKSKLQEVLEGDFECRSYSGRGMYGKSCLGVDIDRGQIGALVAGLIENTRSEDRQEVADAIRHDWSTDSMGLGMIIYFPSIPFFDDEEEVQKRRFLDEEDELDGIGR